MSDQIRRNYTPEYRAVAIGARDPDRPLRRARGARRPRRVPRLAAGRLHHRRRIAGGRRACGATNTRRRQGELHEATSTRVLARAARRRAARRAGAAVAYPTSRSASSCRSRPAAPPRSSRARSRRSSRRSSASRCTSRTRPGGAGTIAMGDVKNAPADGYTHRPGPRGHARGEPVRDEGPSLRRRTGSSCRWRCSRACRTSSW